MRIIKGVPNALTLIAHEIINIESGAVRFIDGVAVAQPERGYPRIDVGTVRTCIRAAVGYIILPAGSDLAAIAESIAQQVIALTAGESLPYHSVSVGALTNVRAMCALTKTYVGDKPTSKSKRSFVIVRSRRGRCKIPTSRFTWFVTEADEFEFAIAHNDIEMSIARHLCSVFYDRDDLVALEHNAVVPELKLSHMRAHANIITTCTPMSDHRIDMIRLNVGKRQAGPLFEIAQHKLYTATMSDVVLAPGDDDVLRCTGCHAPIFGEFYAMDGLLSDMDVPYSMPYCAPCGHTHVDEPYARVFRIDSGIPATVALDEMPADLRDVVEQAELGVRRPSPDVMLIGDKYVSMSQVRYMMTAHPHQARKLVNMKCITDH